MRWQATIGKLDNDAYQFLYSSRFLAEGRTPIVPGRPLVGRPLADEVPHDRLAVVTDLGGLLAARRMKGRKGQQGDGHA